MTHDFKENEFWVADSVFVDRWTAFQITHVTTSFVHIHHAGMGRKRMSKQSNRFIGPYKTLDAAKYAASRLTDKFQGATRHAEEVKAAALAKEQARCAEGGV